VAQFLALTDGLVKNTNCLLVLAATNKPWVLDEAVVRPGRLGTHIYVGPPDGKAREAIVAWNMREVPVAGDVSFGDIASKTESYSGADVAELCDRAKRYAINRQIASGSQETVTAEDFAKAIEKVKPSITSEMLKEFESWRNAGTKPPDTEEDE
jgi:SpoVK/Ycf46/Vps4 family AAA+-type ATPase